MARNVIVFGRIGRETLPQALRQRHDVVNVRIGDTREPGTFRSDVRRLREICAESWNARLFDLLTAACTLRAADRYHPSGDLFDNARRMTIAASMIDAARWRRLAPQLRRTVFLLSNDRVDLFPIELGRKPRDAAPAAGGARAAAIRAYAPDSVCLFSGGADSFCGAAHLLAEGRRPLLVSQSVGPVSRRQKELFAALQARFPQLADAALVQLRAFPNSAPDTSARARRWRSQDDLQRLRTMFFFSLAAIAARGFGLDELFMCENGVIGAAIIFAPDQDSPYTTRSAEPRYLRQMQMLLRGALDAPSLRIRNPFQYSTKGEVLAESAALGLTDALYQTVSCWRIGNRGVQNCGVCVPCMYRQLAFHEAGLPARRSEYRTGAIPATRWKDWPSRDRSYLYAVREYCANVEQRGKSWLFGYEQAVADAIDVTGGSTRTRAVPDAEQGKLDDQASEKVAAMLTRFARATMARLQ